MVRPWPDWPDQSLRACSMRGTVEEPIKHEAKPSALLVSYPSAVSQGTA